MGMGEKLTPLGSKGGKKKAEKKTPGFWQVQGGEALKIEKLRSLNSRRGTGGIGRGARGNRLFGRSSRPIRGHSSSRKNGQRGGKGKERTPRRAPAEQGATKVGWRTSPSVTGGGDTGERNFLF